MRKLHLVGVTDDQKGLIFSGRRGSRSGGYVVPIEDGLIDAIADARRAADGGSSAQLNALTGSQDDDQRRPPRPNSVLTPREIQARLRAGRTIAEVAAEAQVGTEWVERFAIPILAEQNQVVEHARTLNYSKPRLGESSKPLDKSVGQNLADRGVRLPDDVFDAAWSAYQLHDSVWVVRFRYQSRGRLQDAVWELDAETDVLTSRNRLASELGYVDRSRRRRRIKDQPAASEPDGEVSPPPAPKRATKATAKRAPAKRAPAKRAPAKRAPAGARRPAAKKAAKASARPRKAAARSTPRPAGAAKKRVATTRQAARAQARPARSGTAKRPAGASSMTRTSAAGAAPPADATSPLRPVAPRLSADRPAPVPRADIPRSASEPASVRPSVAPSAGAIPVPPPARVAATVPRPSSAEAMPVADTVVAAREMPAAPLTGDIDIESLLEPAPPPPPPDEVEDVDVPLLVRRVRAKRVVIAAPPASEAAEGARQAPPMDAEAPAMDAETPGGLRIRRPLRFRPSPAT